MNVVNSWDPMACVTDVWGKAISRVVVLQHVRVAMDVTTGFSVYVVIMLNMVIVDSHRTRVNLMCQIAQQVRVMWQSMRTMIHQSNQGLPQLTVLQVSQCFCFWMDPVWVVHFSFYRVCRVCSISSTFLCRETAGRYCSRVVEFGSHRHIPW